jgi:hypothetical protein
VFTPSFFQVFETSWEVTVLGETINRQISASLSGASRSGGNQAAFTLNHETKYSVNNKNDNDNVTLAPLYYRDVTNFFIICRELILTGVS